MKRVMAEEGVKCIVVMASKTETADCADRAVMRDMAETMSIGSLCRL